MSFEGEARRKVRGILKYYCGNASQSKRERPADLADVAGETSTSHMT